MKIGLEAISFDVPRHYVELQDLALARGIEPRKYTIGLGQKQMAVPTPYEDSVTLAATAGRRLIQDFDIDPSSIAMLIVGTETGIDHSKPVSSYVHQFLGLSQACRVFEIKHACYGAMAGLTTAIHYIQSGRAKGRKVLVIASDIARYEINSAAEPTQGAGAVALLVSDTPTLLEFDTENEGFFSKQVMDFWRPLYSKEAMADGHYSIQCYLEALAGAYQMYKESVTASREPPFEGLFGENLPGEKFADQYAACLYHVPFAKMAQKAHQKLLEIDQNKVIQKESPEWQLSLQDFEKRVAPSLELNSRVGNIYTGALFLSLINFLEDFGNSAVRKRLSLFSYGSGCAAEFMTGTVLPGASDSLKKHGFRDVLEERQSLSIPEYEELYHLCSDRSLSGDFAAFEKWKPQRSILFLGVENHKRKYSVDGVVV